MTRQLSKACCLLVLSALLSACGTTPQSTHYLLTATLDGVPTQQSPAIGVGPIEIPEYLNRNTLAYRGDGNELKIDQQARWAEPLEDGISRVVSLNLAGLLNTENVRTYPWHPKRPPDFGVKVRILGMDALNGEAVLISEWFVYRPAQENTGERKISRHSLTLDGQQAVSGQLAVAYSTLLLQLSEDIAASIESSGEPTQ